MPLQLTVIFVALCCILNIVIAAFFGAKFRASYKKSQNEQMKYFSLFFIFLAVFLLINTFPHVLGVFEAFGLPLLSLLGPYLNAIGIGSFIVGYAFLYIALAYFAMFVSSIGFPRFKRQAFGLVVLMGLVITILNVLRPKVLTIDPFTKGVILQAEPLVINLMIFVLALIWIPSIIIFISRAIKIASGEIRVRSVLLILGLLLILIRLLSHDFLRGIEFHVIWDTSFSVGLIFIAAIFYFGKGEKKEELIQKTF
jgi:hypothetical protein